MGATERTAVSRASNVNTWGAFYRGYSRNDGDAAVGSNERTVRDTGFITGADVALTRNIVAGLAVSGGRTDWGLNCLGSGDGDAVQLGGYYAARSGPVYFLADGAYAHTWFDTSRSVLGIGHTSEFEGETTARALRRVSSQGRWLDFVPFAAFQGMWFNSDSYTEVNLAGNGAPLSFAKVDVKDVRSELGLTISDDVVYNGDQIRLELKTAWVHRWADTPSRLHHLLGFRRPHSRSSVRSCQRMRSGSD